MVEAATHDVRVIPQISGVHAGSTMSEFAAKMGTDLAESQAAPVAPLRSAG